MKTRRTLGAAMLTFVCALGFGVTATAEAGYDGATTARIETIYLFNEWLNPLSINTTTKDGVVTLTGTVDDDIEKQLAEKIALSVDGVTRVDNQLTIDPNQMRKDGEGADERSEKRADLQNRVKAANLEASIQRQLGYSATFNSASDLKVEVDPDDFEAKLTGHVPDESAQRRAEQIAKDTPGITGVENELGIDENAPALVAESGKANAAKGDESEANAKADSETTVLEDEWVEKAVETRIAFNKHLNLRSFDVEVDNGVCKISGSVISEEQKQLASEIAADTDGVADVMNNVKIIPWKTAALQ